MYISHVRIDRIGCFQSGEQGVDLDLRRPDGTMAGWTVITGHNGAGKSTFLRAVALAVAGARESVRLQESAAGWIRRGEQSGVVRLTLAPEAHDGAGNAADDTRLTVATVWQSEAPVPPQGSTWNETAEVEPLAEDSVHHGTALAPARAQRPARSWFVAAYGPLRRFSSDESGAQPPGMRAPKHIARLANLFREDAPLGNGIEWLREMNHKRLEGQPGAQALQDAVIALLDDGLLPDGARVARVDSAGLWIEQGGVCLRLQDLSGGYRAVIALVIDLARRMHECYGALPLQQRNDGHIAIDLPGVVLIDEVDVHLHVSWQQRLGFWLKQRFPRVQFIVSTHSPLVCQAADARGLIRLPAPGEQGGAAHVPAPLFHQVVNGSLDDAVLTDLFGLPHSRSAEAEHKLQELAALEVELLRDRISDEERARYQALKAELPLSPTSEVERILRRLETTLASPADSKDEAGGT